MGSLVPLLQYSECLIFIDLFQGLSFAMLPPLLGSYEILTKRHGYVALDY